MIEKICTVCRGRKFEVLFKKDGFHIIMCRKCGLVRTRELPTVSYGRYHRDEDYQKFESLFRNIFQKRFNIIQRYKRPGKILDIGASTGTMLQVFKENEWDTYGIEPSGSALFAKKRGLKIYKSTFEKVKLKKNFFDAVILNHTLEHVEDPVEVLKKVKKILKRDGIVLVDVPNFGGLTAQILKAKWPFLTPNEHIHHFTRDTLKKVFEKAGLKVIHSESRSGLFEFADPLGEVLESLVTLKKRFFKNLIFLPYNIVTTAIDKGNSISMVGKNA